jgi:hypothetical protein
MLSKPFIQAFLVFFCLSIGSIYGQSADSAVSKLDRFHRLTPIEKVYLHTDREVYSYDETIWFSVYLVEGIRHMASNLSSLVYVDLIDPSQRIVTTLPIRIVDGKGAGDFFLPDSIAEGTYQLRAYTNYMRNFDPDFLFTKQIKLVGLSRESLSDPPQRNSDIDFQVFPEGGHLIAEQLNYVAFKVTDNQGRGIDLEGEIRDETGASVAQFVTAHLGMGRFQVTPSSGTRYVAVFKYGGLDFSIPLPPVQSSGYALNIRKTTQKTYITVKGTDVSMDGCYVLGHARGAAFTVFQANEGSDFIYNALSNTSMPSGILHFTLFKGGSAIAERLVYNENPVLRVNADLSATPTFGTREKAEINLEFGGDVEVDAGSFSVSVLESTMEPNMTTIGGYLLLTSDLKGTIEKPGYFFSLEENSRIEAIDLLMMTHGWRRFRWEDVLTDQYPPVSFYPEKGFSIEGKVVKYLNRNKGEQADLALTFLENPEFWQEAKTQADGTFWFDGLTILDTVTAVIQTVDTKKQTKKKKKKKVGAVPKDKGTFISLDEKTQPGVQEIPIDPFKVKESYRDFLDVVLEIQQIGASYDEKLIILDAMEVEAQRHTMDREYYRENMLYQNPDARVVVDSIPGSQGYTNVFQMIQGNFTGVEIMGTFPNQIVIVRGLSTIQGSNEALFVVDGMPTDASYVSQMDPRRVEFIDLLKGQKGTIYGTPNGVILIYTRRGMGPGIDLDPRGFQAVRHNGFYPPREFYQPQYELMTDEEKLKPDYRVTQYWNPDLKIQSGKGTINYVTSDNTGTFIVYIEGITEDGRIIEDQVEFSVN